MEDTRELTYKILVVGEYGVGKTSIIKRYIEGVFQANYRLTIGVDFAVKSLKWDDNTNVTLQLWDIAGHERFGSMTRVYYKNAIGAFVVYDLTRPDTLEASMKWLHDINSKVILANGDPIPVILLANKCELETDIIDEKKLAEICKTFSIRHWMTTSAKDNINIDAAVQNMVEEIMSLNGTGTLSEEYLQSSLDATTLTKYSMEVPSEEEEGKGCCTIL